MVNVVRAERKSSVLSASSLACLANIPSINLTSGCAHGCIYCYACGYSNFPGKNEVIIYKNILEKLKTELLRKRKKPVAVYFSPSSDIFQPIPELNEISHAVLEFLLSEGIGISFLTKGRIPEKTLNLLLDHADKIKAQMGIITFDDNIRGMFEPNAASIDVRLAQMAKMISGGIAVELRLVPILPGITDTLASIEQLFHTISAIGVNYAAISTLFLRPAVATSLKDSISDKEILGGLLDLYKGSMRMNVHAAHSSVIPLPLKNRQEIYSHFRQVASRYQIELSVCGCMNPDIGGVCNIAGKWLTNEPQSCLFNQE